jgi:hypothetical protein
MMTMQCPLCKHYQKDLKCEAFPDGIPEKILTGRTNHSKPFAGEKIVFESKIAPEKSGEAK